MTRMTRRLLEFLARHHRGLTRAVLGLMAVLVIVDVLVPPAYTRFPWDSLGGFAALYGFVSCVLIIVVSKALGYGLLYKPEDYYDPEPGDRDERDPEEGGPS